MFKDHTLFLHDISWAINQHLFQFRVSKEINKHRKPRISPVWFSKIFQSLWRKYFFTFSLAPTRHYIDLAKLFPQNGLGFYCNLLELSGLRLKDKSWPSVMRAKIRAYQRTPGLVSNAYPNSQCLLVQWFLISRSHCTNIFLLSTQVISTGQLLDHQSILTPVQNKISVNSPGFLKYLQWIQGETHTNHYESFFQIS